MHKIVVLIDISESSWPYGPILFHFHSSKLGSKVFRFNAANLLACRNIQGIKIDYALVTLW